MEIIENMSWENILMDAHDDAAPRARAGHCSVSVSFLCLYQLSPWKQMKPIFPPNKAQVSHVINEYI